MRLRLTSLLILSVVIALACHVTTTQFGFRMIDQGIGGGNFSAWWWQWYGALDYINVGLRALWVAVFIVGWLAHDWRALWLLIGAPLALLQPRDLGWILLIVAILFKCMFGTCDGP
jgi:hypothetical protein